MIEPKPLILIEGPVGAGKSTAANAVAEELGLSCLFGSNILRLLGWHALQGTPATGLHAKLLQYGPDVMMSPLTAPQLRTEQVGLIAGQLANDPVIYHGMIDLARQAYASCPRGLIAEGRGLATEIFPSMAALSIYMTATLAARAARVSQRLPNQSPQAVSATIDSRDQADMRKTFFRLAIAPDAVMLDTTNLSAQETQQRIITLARQRYLSLQQP